MSEQGEPKEPCTPTKLHKPEEPDQPGETSCKPIYSGLAGEHGSLGTLTGNHAN